MNLRAFLLTLLLLPLAFTGCRPSSEATASAGPDPHFTTNGTLEVTARLVEIPDGAIFQRELYDYATVLKYEVVTVKRGNLTPGTQLWVGHYNPWKPRSEAADARAPGIGGALRQFRAGDLHHLALDVPIEDHFMGGIVNKYFGQTTNAIYWAIWTSPAER
ncbi:MAG: hypothetical protein JNK85_07300 [Verrucomicrobiales bacterium]|nr:hypothetical protein [Verrucomicrobiales bacterium]